MDITSVVTSFDSRTLYDESVKPLFVIISLHGSGAIKLRPKNGNNRAVPTVSSVDRPTVKRHDNAEIGARHILKEDRYASRKDTS